MAIVRLRQILHEKRYRRAENKKHRTDRVNWHESNRINRVCVQFEREEEKNFNLKSSYTPHNYIK